MEGNGDVHGGWNQLQLNTLTPVWHAKVEFIQESKILFKKEIFIFKTKEIVQP
jgi:hypothetical protein